MRWRSSFRTRVVVLVATITAVAIGVTVWVTVTATSQTITDSAQARQQDLDLIVDQVRDYGIAHGTWVGVPDLAEQLRQQTGQRIQLSTEDGVVVVDTDTLEGRTARPASSVAPVAIVPRPAFDLTGVSAGVAQDVTLTTLQRYRADVVVGVCLTGMGLGAPAQAPEYGVATVALDDPTVVGAGCFPPPQADEVTVADRAAVTACVPDGVVRELPADTATPAPTSSGSSTGSSTGSTDGEVDSCLENAFRARTADDGAVTLLLDTGVRGSATLGRDTAQILYAAIPVLLLAIAVAVLLARRALRPVDAVIRASHRFAAGERSARVRVRGRDEMAELAASFNGMAESVQRSEAQQRSMVADVAHELRTPLANIRGYVEALRDGVLPPTPEVFESLHEEALLQQRVIDDLQDLALADRHDLIAHRVRTDVADLVRLVRSAHAVRAEAAGVLLQVDAPAPVLADVDPDRMRQAIGNLVTNALRATPAGGTVTLRTRVDGDRARIEVEDTGHGMPAEQLGRVFDRFWRAEPSRARSTGGSGLGLAITREIVRGHGGTVEVRSTEGVGTVFTLCVPAA